MTIRFQEGHLQRFSAASFDTNPLHLSEDYARKSAYGERVVFGMLGCLASLAQTPVPEGQRPAAVSVDFKGPLLLDIDYSVAISPERLGGLKVTLMDGSATAMVMRLRFESGTPALAVLPEAGTATQHQARLLAAEDLREGLSFRGLYGPGASSYSALLELLGLDRAAWGDAVPLAFLASSYLTGMELPGESAAFTGMRAEFLPVGAEVPSQFEIVLDSYDGRFGRVESRFSLAGEPGAYVRGEITAVARPSRARTQVANLKTGSGRFAGKTAVVIGASRGLGSALALQLVADGCTVIGVYAKSRDAADEMAEASRGLPGRLLMEQGDPADVGWCVALKNRVKEEHGQLDLLICNAAPTVQSLRIEAAYYDRISSYMQKGFALVAAPLTGFVDLVSASAGRVLLISSSYVEETPAIFPHYVALKAAAEGFVRTTSAAYPKVSFWIARPGKLRTDMTNTPVGWLDAAEPELVAAQVLQAVATDTKPGAVQFWR